MKRAAQASLHDAHSGHRSILKPVHRWALQFDRQSADGWEVSSRTALRSLLLAIAVLGCGSASAHAQSLLIGVDPSLSASQTRAILAVAGQPVGREAVSTPAASAVGLVELEVPASTAERIATALDGVAGVRYVEPDHRVKAFAAAPNDSHYPEQWGLAKIGSTASWERSRGAGILVAVIDTGVDHSHPELQGRVVMGRDFVNDDDDPMDVQGHGTHVAGVIAAATGNGSGIAGVAPDAQILAVRVLGDDGSGDYSDVINGITHAVDRGAKVINLSLGGDETSNAMRDALRYATSRGVVVTCASGNESSSQVSYPARYDECISVGATNENDQRASFSNYGEGLDIVAPGAAVLSTIMGPSYESWDGTSMAAPFVAGVAAQLLAQGLDAQQARVAMETTATDIADAGHDVTTGAGRLDANAATAAAASGRVQAGDSEAPTISRVSLGKRTTRIKTQTKVRWKVIKRTKWRIVGDSPAWGAFTWNEVKTRGNKQTVVQYKLNNGIVKARTTVKKKTRTRTRRRVVERGIVVHAADNVGIRSVSVSLDGKPLGADRSASGGYEVRFACSPRTAAVSATAVDTSGRTTVYESRLKIAC